MHPRRFDHQVAEKHATITQLRARLDTATSEAEGAKEQLQKAKALNQVGFLQPLPLPAGAA